MEILYSDSGIIVCVKPVGMDSQRQVPEALAAALGGDVYPVHRLDQGVGGVMVYARTAEAAAELAQAVRTGGLQKEYVAQVHGQPPEQGDWRDLLWKSGRENKTYVVKRRRQGVREARLEFTRLQAGEPCLVRIRLHTGRSHQIRVQFASRGYPLLGDHKYGARDGLTAPRLFACRLEFPWRGRQMVFEQLPDWAVGLSSMGILIATHPECP